MNFIIESFARKWLVENLPFCTDGQRHMFKRMYSHQNLDVNIVQVVEAMPASKLDNAMMQVDRTIKNNGGAK